MINIHNNNNIIRGHRHIKYSIYATVANTFPQILRMSVQLDGV